MKHHKCYVEHFCMYISCNVVNQSIVRRMYPFKISAIRMFYSLEATFPSSYAGLPKCTRNLMAHDPFNTRRADMKSAKTKAGRPKAKDSGGVIKREVAPDPNSLTINMSCEKIK